MNKGKFQNLPRYKLDNKQLQYTNCQISQEVKTISQGNLFKKNFTYKQGVNLMSLTTE